MKPLIDILRQLGLDTTSPPMEAFGSQEDLAPSEATPIPIPPGLMDLFKARVQAAHALAHVEWPQRGQILQLEKLQPTFDERPFAVLLTERTATPNVWAGYVVAPESELDYSADGDITLDELGVLRDPMAGFVQSWNAVRIPIPSATVCLAWLDREAMDRVLSAVASQPGGPDLRLSALIQEYRGIYRHAAGYWASLAAQLQYPLTPGPGWLDRLRAQLANLAQVAPVGEWRLAMEHPMGPEDDQQLLWNLADLEIRVDSHVCKIRKLGGDDRLAKVDLLLDDLLLESHSLAEAGESAVIQLTPAHHAGKLTLFIKQLGGVCIEIVL